jgi:hypothetical protein
MRETSMRQPAKPRLTASRTVALTISAATYTRLINHPLPSGTLTGKANPDGTVTFRLDALLTQLLARINSDPERALLTLLDVKPH